MLETIIMILAYGVTLCAGGITNYIGQWRKILCLLVIGIGGFVFCWFSQYPLNWVGWGSYMTGFLLVFFVGKKDSKEILEKEVAEALQEDYNHITKDANGNVKVRTFKIYNGGLSR
jgi:hypothetical protein